MIFQQTGHDWLAGYARYVEEAWGVDDFQIALPSLQYLRRTNHDVYEK
jgi:hypothetical protein